MEDVVIVGAGFTGLSAAFELVKAGHKVTILEAESEIGGLASAFEVGGNKLDRFYHHWFTNDVHVMGLIKELGVEHKVEINPTNTGMYFANTIFKLSTPIDLLKFRPLKFLDRIRLGLLTLSARRVKDWKQLEYLTAKEWLLKLGGENVYKVVWEPLLKGKFGPYAEDVSAVWFWNKIKLRGGSRGKQGEERLAYFKGGFVALAEDLAQFIEAKGGKIVKNCTVKSIDRRSESWIISTDQSEYTAKKVLSTIALPLIADTISKWADQSVITSLRRINYLSNVCMILELNQSLSKTYWLNVNELSFPFVGVIEHTNFERPSSYGGSHIVYLSKYLPHTDELYSLNDQEFFEFAFPYLKKMFPSFEKSWVKKFHLWKARWSQPVVERSYSQLIPQAEIGNDGFYICSMAQIYPEDRGTNYAIREGRIIADKIAKTF